MQWRAIIVEDYPLMREQLGVLLDRIEELTVCGSFSSGEQALGEFPEPDPDLALLDISLPGMNGFDLAAEVRKRCPNIRCVVLSGHRSQGYIDRARELGLNGYVVKGSLGELKKALYKVMAGGTYFTQL